jgi:hypothetical protein
VAAGVVLEEDELAVLADDAEPVDGGLQVGRDGLSGISGTSGSAAGPG